MFHFAHIRDFFSVLLHVNVNDTVNTHTEWINSKMF